MSTNNKVFQILVTKSNRALLAAGGAVSGLAEGQIGIFDADTNLAVDATSMGSYIPKNFYIGVGLAGGEVAFSAGQLIQKSLVRNVNLQKPVTAVSQVLHIDNYFAENGLEYAIKLEFRNMEIYTRQGTNQFTKTFTATTSEDTAVDPVHDVAWKLFEAMMIGADGLFTVNLLDPSDSDAVIADAIADKADYYTWSNLETTPGTRDHVGVIPTFKITPVDLAINAYLGINPTYKYPRTTVIIPSFPAGFNGDEVVTEATAPKAVQGIGYDIQQKEYKAGGFNGKPGPYRTSTSLGFPYAELADAFHAVAGTSYIQIHIVNDFYSTAGWGEYINNCQTTIAVPTGETTTTTPLLAALNLLLDASLTLS